MGIKFLNQTTLKGNQEKFEENGFYYKIDNLGYESISEALVSELECYITDFFHVDYYLCQVDNGEGVVLDACKSKSFLEKGMLEKSLFSIVKMAIKRGDVPIEVLGKYQGKDLVNKVLDIVYNATELDAKEYIGKMLYLDYITLNDDRHLNNITFSLKDGVWGFIPVYDNGGSLLSDLSKYSEDTDLLKNIRKVKSKPFSTSFRRQCSYFLDDVDLLEVDIDGFLTKLEDVEKDIKYSVPFKRDSYRRAKQALEYQLKQTEGIVWKRK